MSKFNDGEGCGGCFFEVFGELAVYVILFLIGGGVLMALGFLPEDMDADTVVFVGVGVIVALGILIGLPIYFVKKGKRGKSNYMRIPFYTGEAMEEHNFTGKWITDSDFAEREPRNVFHRQLHKIDLPPDELSNSHILFRKKFTVDGDFESAKIFITADDYYKLYINGMFVAQGPAPSYHNCYNYNEFEVGSFLRTGENVIAIHTYYQGLINRVWQSGDYRHGLIMDLDIDGEVIVSSDEGFLCKRHTAYSAVGISGYQTQFMERYDSRAAECGFYKPDFDDSEWENACLREFVDYTLVPQRSKMLDFEEIKPKSLQTVGNKTLIDFGGMYVGVISARAKGADGEKLTIKMGQELNEDGSVRYNLRCNCTYLEEWILSGGDDLLEQFDYKAFRYAEIETEGAQLSDICLIARHYPFELKASLKKEFVGNERAERIWELCVRTQKYGIQETIQDCPDREKGFYLGDGCYDAFANYILTGDDSMVRKLIDDAFASSFICEGLVTCMSCSFMQEIAEYPLILPDLMLWHYKASGDIEYLRKNTVKMQRVLDFYRENYENDYILNNLDRWCVVEWPKNYQDGYAAEVAEGKVSTEAHIAINAYYYRAILVTNKLCSLAGLLEYRDDEQTIYDAIIDRFYDKDSHLFVDGEEHRHISLVGNAFPYAFDMAPDKIFEANFRKMLAEKGEDATSFFTTFPLLFKFTRDQDYEQVDRYLLHEGTWRRMLREDATSTFEGWGKDCKWNTSLFHLTMSSAAMFMADIDLKGFLE